MRVAVLFPTRMESAPFEGRVAAGALLAQMECRVDICGVGVAECAASVARVAVDFRPDVVVLAGVAGSYTDELKFGDTVAVAVERLADMGRVESWSELGGERFTPLFQKDYLLDELPEGLTAVRSNTVSGCGIPYIKTSDVEVENMEGAGFAAVAAALNLHCMEIRTISNRVGERFGRQEVEQCAEVLADRLCDILRQLK